MLGLMFSRFILLFTLIVFIFSSFLECGLHDNVLYSLPLYVNKEIYAQKDGFQDYTDYEKYYYASVTSEDLDDNKYFHEVTADDIETIKSYYNDFQKWWITVHSDIVYDYYDDYNEYDDYSEYYEYDEYYDKFDFEIDQIKEGDYFYIYTGEDYNNDRYHYKFENYTVYYFDLEEQTLYYLHNNT